MQVTVKRSELLSAIQAVVGVVEKRQTMPILSNVMVETSDAGIVVTATDLELELITHCPAQVEHPGSVTIPARKLLDICRGLEKDSELSLAQDQNGVRVTSGRSRFTLAVMTAANWPRLDEVNTQQQFTVNQVVLGELLAKTHFAMASQDVRYYLNGLLLVLMPNMIRCVATDGHRLALSEVEWTTGIEETIQVIVPRKAVNELMRGLVTEEENAAIQVSDRHIRVELSGITLTSKLIDGRFPDYERVIPDIAPDRMRADRQVLRQALSRTAVLSNENYRGVRLVLSAGNLQLQAQNVDQEEARDEIPVEYKGDELEIGFNITYLLDALGAISDDDITLDLAGPDSSGLIQAADDASTRYVIMPMRL